MDETTETGIMEVQETEIQETEVQIVCEIPLQTTQLVQQMETTQR